MIGTGRTTLGILGFTDLGPDSVAVVTAAAGGIGTLLVQYAKNAGATVIALAGGPAKVARAEANGADLALDYTLPNWPDHARAFLDATGQWATVVYDSVGGTTTAAPSACSARAGSTSSTAGPARASATGSRSPSPLRSWRSAPSPPAPSSGPSWSSGQRRARPGDRALAEAAAGRLRPAVQRYPLAEAAAAHRALETRGTIGKVVLEP
ncbi:Zinc-binding dehydrogenase OS=Streptomyces microflavus OX=1919 GN=HUT09_19310 PE=4 SV=1 [Streptomyces microflavus]